MMTERPNTVSGLVAKRAELVKLRADLERELRGVTSDLDHIDGAIRLFDPAQTPAARKRYATKHRAREAQAGEHDRDDADGLGDRSRQGLHDGVERAFPGHGGARACGPGWAHRKEDRCAGDEGQGGRSARPHLA